jgi:hypothetical protein
MELLETWRKWDKAAPPYILEADNSVLASERSMLATEQSFVSWTDIYSGESFNKPGDRKLHLGLVPHPFCGDLLNAEVYILMLNPGYGSHDYFAELEVADYTDAARKNLKQTFTPDDFPFFLLNPQFAWTGGFMWWHKKFAYTIEELAGMNGISYAAARHLLSQKIASIELIPYHSTSFYDAGNWRKKLPSVKMARLFVHDYVLPRIMNNQAIIIVTRQASEWDLPEHPNIIKYSSSQARGAHLSPNSPGGKAILAQLYHSA